MTREFDRAREDAFALPGYLFGLTMSTAGSSTTLTIAAGFATDSTNVKLIRLAASLAKTSSPYSAGAAGGAYDGAGTSASSWYHWFLIFNPTTQVTDALFSASATAPLLPSGFTLFRRIGSAKLTGGTQWIKFVQDGDVFMWDSPIGDVAAVTNPGTSAVLRTLSVPIGVRVQALMMVILQGAGAADLPASTYISDPSVADNGAQVQFSSVEIYIPSYTGSFAVGSQVTCFTNTSSQVRSRLQISAANTQLTIDTNGWVDTRGRLF